MPGSVAQKTCQALAEYTFIQSALTLLLLTYFFSVPRCTLLRSPWSRRRSLQFGSHAVRVDAALYGTSSPSFLQPPAACRRRSRAWPRRRCARRPPRPRAHLAAFTTYSPRRLGRRRHRQLGGHRPRTARHLLRLGATVVFRPHRARARAAMAGARDGRAVGEGRLAALDMADCASVRVFRHVQEGYRPRPRRRAGVQRRRNAPAAEGVGARLVDELGVHQLGHLLTQLLPRLRTAAAEGGGRGVVVSVASSLHKIAPRRAPSSWTTR